MNGNGTEWIEQGLPIPSYHELINRGYILAYEIEGYFGTLRGQEYLNDIIARVMLTFSDLKPQNLKYKPNITDYGTYLPKIYKLKELQSLKSLQNRVKIPVRADSFQDVVFWAIKLFCEDLIRAQGIVSYEQLEQFAIDNFISNKDRSTLKAKCKSIWNYYEAKEWKLNKKVWKMTRSERALSNAENKEKRSRNKIINATTGLMSEIYKKKNGKWHIKKIAEDTQLDQRTVSKHLKDMELI